MAITIEISSKAQDDIGDLDAVIQAYFREKMDVAARDWPNVPKKPMTAKWRLHYRLALRKDWRIVVKPERDLLVVVRVLHRSSREYGGNVRRDVEGPFVVVPRSFVREALRNKPTRNFASEYAMWSLGQNLSAARKACGLNQATLARRIGKAQSTVSMAEKGQIRVSSTYVRAVLRACKLPISWSVRNWAV